MNSYESAVSEQRNASDVSKVSPSKKDKCRIETAAKTETKYRIEMDEAGNKSISQLNNPKCEKFVQELRPSISSRSQQDTTKVSKTDADAPQLEKELSRSAIAQVELHEQLQDSRAECETLKTTLLKVQSELNDAQDFIFSRQPVQQNVTHNDASAEYTTLCQTVESWVNCELGEAIDEKKLLRPKGSANIEAFKTAISFLKESGLQAINYPDTDIYNIIAIAMEFLCVEILEKPFYGAVSKQEMKNLDLIEKSMKCLQPPRDIAMCRAWRSETFHALANRHDIVNQRNVRKKELSTSLARIMRIFDPHAQAIELRSSIQKKIIEPATDLADKLHLSVDRFYLEYSAWTAVPQQEKEPIDCSRFDCLDIMTNKSIKVPNEQSKMRSDLIYLLDVAPGLFCETYKGDVPSPVKTLKSSRILVFVRKPSGEGYDRQISKREDRTILHYIVSAVKKPQQKPPISFLGF